LVINYQSMLAEQGSSGPASSSSTTTTTTTSSALSTSFNPLYSYSTDSNFQMVDQSIRTQVPQLINGQIISVQYQTVGQTTSYKIRYQLVDGSIVDVQSSLNNGNVIVQSATSNGVATTSSSSSNTTSSTTSEKLLANFQSDDGVKKVNEYVRSQIPVLSSATIVGVWVSNTPEGLTTYRIRYLTVNGSFVEISLAYQPQKGVVQINNQPTFSTSAAQTILATTLDGYQLLRNFGIDTNFVRADQYVRSRMPELSGAQVSAVWTMQITNVGTSYRIRYTTTNNTVLEVTVVYRADTGQFEFNPTPLTTPPTTVTTTTITKVGYQALQDYSTNLDFQSVDQYIRSRMQNLGNAQIIAVWVETLPNSNNYRVQYLLADGSILEIIISYVKSTGTYQITSTN
jgi:hypothetical protein